MLTFLARRLLLIPPTLLLVMLAVFVILRVTGDPVEIFLDVNSTPEQRARLTEELHLDRSLPVQFGYFVAGLVQGDFGRSLTFQGPALPIVIERLGATAVLVAAALAIAVGFGVLLGLWCAVRRDRMTDLIISSLSVAGQSMPSFWLGLLLIQFFALDLGWFPTSGFGGPWHLVLPAVTLSTFLLPNFVLVTRTSVLETIGEPYVTTAQAKGLGDTWILFRHVLPNALNPVLSLLGLQMGRLMGGSIVTETIFAWPGVGRLIIGSIFQRDVPIVAACVLIISLAIVVANLIVDLVLALLDPRIRVR